MSKPKPPSQPSPQSVANAQTQSNQATARTEATLNRYDQNTPYGSVLWTNHGGDRWSQNVTESDSQRQLRELQEQQGIQLGQLGIEQTGKVQDILGSNYDPRRFDTNAVTGGPLDIAGALGDYGGDVEARTRELAMRGLEPMFNRSEESLRSRLAAQGVNAGTEAFGSEMEAFNTGKGNAYAAAELAARDTARNDRGQMLSELLGERGTNLTEAQGQYSMDTTADLAARQNPLNEIIALMSGVQTNPINPGSPGYTGVNGTDVAGIYQNNFANQMAGYQSEMSNRNALLGGLASLGGAAMGSPWLFAGGKG